LKLNRFRSHLNVERLRGALPEIPLHVYLSVLHARGRRELEKTTINSLLHRLSPALEVYGHSEPAWAVK
jgi:hypothetical protein